MAESKDSQGTKKHLVTIDGPSASGKTTVSRELARHMGWQWVSTGAFYRAIAYAVQQNQVSLDDEDAIVEVIDAAEWMVEMTAEKTNVHFRGEDVSSKAFREELGSVASRISVFPRVRQALLAAQRACYKKAEKGFVAEGRDCGTVVFPEAEIKIYLTASQENRLARRSLEEGGSSSEILEKQRQRDQRDESRMTAPLEAAADAITIDTTSIDLDGVVAKVIEIVEG